MQWNYLEYTCNKYCDLIGYSEVSISHRDLQVFHRDLQVSIETYKLVPGATIIAHHCNAR